MVASGWHARLLSETNDLVVGLALHQGRILKGKVDLVVGFVLYQSSILKGKVDLVAGFVLYQGIILKGKVDLVEVLYCIRTEFGKVKLIWALRSTQLKMGTRKKCSGEVKVVGVILTLLCTDWYKNMGASAICLKDLG